jgi:small multidrug resistance pump
MISIHWLSLLVALTLNATANVLMKVGMSRIDLAGGVFKDGAAGAIFKVLSSPVLVIGLLCFGLNACFYMFALQSKALKISIAYPVMVGGGYAIIAVVGYLLLGERLTWIQTAGVALILSGVVLIAAQTPEVAPV